jgi:peptide deformylase
MELLKAPNKWLDKKIETEFDFDKLDAKQISGEMANLMMKNNGIGLAANQVGLDARIFVMRPLEHKEITKPFAIINPIIREISEELISEKEGCLSSPLLFLKIARPAKVVAQFLDLDAKECIIEFTGIDARCFLHEYDHLEGIDFSHRTSRLKVDIAKTRQKKLLRKLRKSNNG